MSAIRPPMQVQVCERGGAGVHNCLTAHHLVRDELNEIDPKLLPLYDRFAAAMAVYNWRGDGMLIHGRPMRFWKRIHKPRHPFHNHPLLRRHGLTLARAARVQALQRGRQKGVSCMPVAHTCHIIGLLWKLQWKERSLRPLLETLAVRANSLIWGLPEHRMNAQLTMSVAFGRIRMPKTFTGIMLRAGAVAYGGVIRDGPEFRVVAKAQIWPLLSHELIKATAELVCLHGLNTLDRETYDAVMQTVDKIEYEPWHLGVGPELWRRLLPLVPRGATVAETLMRIAKLPPPALERLMIAVIEEPDWARELIEAL